MKLRTNLDRTQLSTISKALSTAAEKKLPALENPAESDLMDEFFDTFSTMLSNLGKSIQTTVKD